MFDTTLESVCSTVAYSRFLKSRTVAAAFLAAMLILPGLAGAELPDELQWPIRETIEEAVVGSTRALGGAFRGPIAVIHSGNQGDAGRLGADYLRFVTSELVRTQSVEIDSPEKLADRLEILYMDLADLGDRTKRQAFYRSPQGRQLQWVVILDSDNRPQEVIVSMTLEKVESGESTAPFVRAVDKVGSIYEYLGEPIPRSLFVKAPKGAKVRVGNKFVGYGGDEALMVRLLPGKHDLRVSLDGYARFDDSINIGGLNDMDLEIKKRNNSGAPLKSFLLGAILPGSSVVAYGSPKTDGGKHSRKSDEFTTASAGIFYVGLTVWALDHFRDKNPLTNDTRDRDDKIENIELGICLTGYALNLIGSIVVGRDFAKENRELVVGSMSSRARNLSWSDLPRSIGFELARGPDGPVPSIAFSTSF